jgi:hypothetical protein
VTAALTGCKDVRAHQLLLAIRLAASGQSTAAQIAEQMGVSRRRFFHWANALKAGETCNSHRSDSSPSLGLAGQNTFIDWQRVISLLRPPD